MASIKKTITYFEKPGKANTEETLKLAYEKAQELGISTVVIASTRGETAKLAVETMHKLGKRFGVVINLYGIGNDEVMKYCKNENITIHAMIPNDRRIAELYSRGKLIYPEIPEVQLQLEGLRRFILKNVNGKRKKLLLFLGKGVQGKPPLLHALQVWVLKILSSLTVMWMLRTCIFF